MFVVLAAERVLKFQSYFSDIEHLENTHELHNYAQKVSIRWNKLISDGRRRRLT